LSQKQKISSSKYAHDEEDSISEMSERGKDSKKSLPVQSQKNSAPVKTNPPEDNQPVEGGMIASLISKSTTSSNPAPKVSASPQQIPSKVNPRMDALKKESDTTKNRESSDFDDQLSPSENEEVRDVPKPKPLSTTAKGPSKGGWNEWDEADTPPRPPPPRKDLKNLGMAAPKTLSRAAQPSNKYAASQLGDFDDSDWDDV
jgi:hypothetical protein